MGERVLVTGASGFLGGHVVRDLRAHGYDVTAAGRRADALPSGGPVFVGDLDALGDADVPADVVVHCAALSSPWGRWREFEHANVTGTARVLRYARRVGARRIVHVSSPGIYAAPRDRLGIREHEVDPSRPMNHYIRSKLHAEALLRAASTDPDGPEVVVLRPRGIIGPGDPALVPRLLRVHERLGVPVVRGGRGLVDLTSVENVALVVRSAVEVPDAAGLAFNVTNGDPRPFVAVLDQLLTGLGLPLRHRRLPGGLLYGAAALAEALCTVLPGHPEPPVTRYTVTTITHSQTLDIGRARAVLGYEPVVTLDETLAGYARRGAPWVASGCSPAGRPCTACTSSSATRHGSDGCSRRTSPCTSRASTACCSTPATRSDPGGRERRAGPTAGSCRRPCRPEPRRASRCPTRTASRTWCSRTCTRTTSVGCATSGTRSSW